MLYNMFKGAVRTRQGWGLFDSKAFASAGFPRRLVLGNNDHAGRKPAHERAFFFWATAPPMLVFRHGAR